MRLIRRPATVQMPLQLRARTEFFSGQQQQQQQHRAISGRSFTTDHDQAM